MKAKTRAAMALAIMVMVFLLVHPGSATENCKLIKENGKGKLYDCSGMRMAVLQGNYREMGRQYGALLKDDILAFYKQMIEGFVLKSGLFGEEDLRRLVIDPAIRTQTKRQSELLKGLSEKTGLSFEKHVLLNLNVQTVMYMRKIGSGNATACTSMAAWGDFTVNRRTYTARNLDFPNIYREVAKTSGIVLVMKPNDGSNYVAGVCNAGMINFFDAMNNKGLYVEGNNAADSEGLVIYSDRAVIFDEGTNILFDADTIEAVEGRLRTIRASYPLIFMSAGPDTACYFENGTTDVKKRVANENGLISAANQFLEPSWHILPLKNPGAWYSEARQSRFEALAKANKGRIQEEIMKKILDERLFNKDGSVGRGASVIEKDPKDDEVTVHQVITCPAERKMWVRIPTYTGWIFFDLKKVFKE
ncbi:MAG: hypothetical protein K4571_06585 [Deltaproteobacteria bacterium]